MIIDLLLFIIWIIELVIHDVLSAIPIQLPPDVGTAIVYFAGYVRYAGGFIDLPGVFGALSFLLDFLMAWFTFKVFMWVMHWVLARRAHEKQAMPVQQKT